MNLQQDAGNGTERVADGGTPVGRRVMLGMVGLGAVGIVFGAQAQESVTRALSPVGQGISGIVPAAGGFRYYSVVDEVRAQTTADYALTVSGLVKSPRTFSFADLQALPQTNLVRDFQCVTGWRVPDVPWSGVALPDLLDRVDLDPRAKALRLHSFDGAYTESLTLDQARRRDILIALRMLDGPITHDHGGPVRLYVAPMYGYKSLKWLGGIEIADKVVPGYWERRGYDVDAWVGRSNGRTDAPL